MTTLETAFEVKDEILVLLSKEKNLVHLEEIRAHMAALVIGEQEVDWWDELTIEQQQQLLKILDAVREGKNLLSNEEAWKRLKHWAA
ncbi:MAG: hypothetical protein ACKVUS_17620 [Saprospiraceae bacterium]